MISYARARAEAAGYKASVGLLARPERVILLALFLMIGRPIIAMWILAFCNAPDRDHADRARLADHGSGRENNPGGRSAQVSQDPSEPLQPEILDDYDPSTPIAPQDVASAARGCQAIVIIFLILAVVGCLATFVAIFN